jgi:hypothetical protein
MTAKNKRYSYLRVATIQIDVHPKTYTYFMLDPRMALDHTYLMWSTYSKLCVVINRLEESTIHSTTPDRSTGLCPVSLSS